MDMVGTNDSQYSYGALTSSAFDNLGRPYDCLVAAFGAEDKRYVRSTVLQGVPVKVTYTFSNIDSHATSIAAFSPVYYYKPTNTVFQATFKNITF